jgi:hypothetical protein
MAAGNTIEDVQSLMPVVFEHFEKYRQLLKNRAITIEELAFSKRRSKDFSKYDLKRKTVENSAMVQLNREGKSLIGGQILRYIITNHNGRKERGRAAIPLETIDENTTYDVDRYTELLAQTCNSVIEPFGYNIPVEYPYHPR